MADVDTPFAGPMSMEEALAAQETLQQDTSDADEDVQADAQVEDTEELEASDDVEDTEEDDTETEELDDRSDADEGEESQILNLDEYGEVQIEIDGEAMTLADLAKGNLRQSDYTRKSQEREASHKAKLAEVEAREKDLADREQQLSQLLAENEEQEPDWVKMAEEDPLGVIGKKAAWEQKQKVRAEAAQKAQQEQERQIHEFRTATAEKAVEVFPEWTDGAAFEAGAKARKEVALECGFTEQEYNSTVDFRLAALLEMASKWKSSQSAAKATEKKLAKAPKVIKPGGKPSKEVKQAKVDAARQKRLSGPMTFEQALNIGRE